MKTTTKDDAGPLYKNAHELHDSLVGYAKQALEQALRSTAPGLYYEETIAGDPVKILNETKFRQVFVEEATERLAQVAGYLWMELEGLEARRVKVDGIPLSSLEEAIYAGAFVYSHRVPDAENTVRVYRKGGKK